MVIWHALAGMAVGAQNTTEKIGKTRPQALGKGGGEEGEGCWGRKEGGGMGEGKGGERWGMEE